MVQPSSKDKAELEYYLADAEKLRAETAYIHEQLLTSVYERTQRDSLAAARRLYDFVGEVTEMEVKAAVDELNDWVTHSNAPITIRMCSPGGSFFDGIFLFDFLQDLRRKGIHVTTISLGMAASMAAVLSQAADTRIIGKNAWFMVHEPSSIALGKASDLKDEAKLVGRLHEQLLHILAERSNLSYRQILLKCNRKDWWMNAEEALGYGFFDEIA